MNTLAKLMFMGILSLSGGMALRYEVDSKGFGGFFQRNLDLSSARRTVEDIAHDLFGNSETGVVPCVVPLQGVLSNLTEDQLKNSGLTLAKRLTDNKAKADLQFYFQNETSGNITIADKLDYFRRIVASDNEELVNYGVELLESFLATRQAAMSPLEIATFKAVIKEADYYLKNLEMPETLIICEDKS